MPNPIRILLVDNSPHFLTAARDFLELQAMLEIAGTATNGQSALAQTRALKPDLILLDLNLGQESGLDLIPRFKEHIPKPKIIVLTMHDIAYRAPALQRGADAFVPKSAMDKLLIAAIFQQMQVAPDEQESGSALAGPAVESSKHDPGTDRPSAASPATEPDPETGR